MNQYSYISNAHGSYIEELYQSYQKDPQSVDSSWRQFFEGYEFSEGQVLPSTADANAYKEVQVRYLIHA